MQFPKLSFLALLPTLAGCATVGMMKELPPDAGRLALYAAPPDTLVAIAERTLRQQDLDLADTSRPDGDTRVVIASRAPGLFSNGEYVRVRIAPDSRSRGLMAVRIASRSGHLLDWGHRDHAPRLFAEMDTLLDATALGPWPGMRVRATPHGTTANIGTVARITADTIVLEEGTGGAPRSFAISALDGLAVSRGSYRHTREGVLIGALVGGVLGALLGKTESSEYFQGLSALSNVFVGAAAGTLLGGALGAGARTEVWSPVPIH